MGLGLGLGLGFGLGFGLGLGFGFGLLDASCSKEARPSLTSRRFSSRSAWWKGRRPLSSMYATTPRLHMSHAEV